MKKYLALSCLAACAAMAVAGCPMADKNYDPVGTWTGTMAEGTAKDAKAFNGQFTFHADGTCTFSYDGTVIFSGPYEFQYTVEGDEVTIVAASFVFGGNSVTWHIHLTFEDENHMTGTSSFSAIWGGVHMWVDYTTSITRQPSAS